MASSTVAAGIPARNVAPARSARQRRPAAGRAAVPGRRGRAALGRAQLVERARRALVALADELRPAAAVDEEVVERRAAQQAVVGGVDDRQALAERPARAVRELEL